MVVFSVRGCLLNGTTHSIHSGVSVVDRDPCCRYYLDSDSLWIECLFIFVHPQFMYRIPDTLCTIDACPPLDLSPKSSRFVGFSSHKFEEMCGEISSMWRASWWQSVRVTQPYKRHYALDSQWYIHTHVPPIVRRTCSCVHNLGAL